MYISLYCCCVVRFLQQIQPIFRHFSPRPELKRFVLSLISCLAFCSCLPKRHGANCLCSSFHRRQHWHHPAGPKASVIVLSILSQPAHVETTSQVRVYAVASAEEAEKSGGGQGGPVGFHFHLSGWLVRIPTLVTSSLLSPPPDPIHVQQGEDRAADTAP